MEELTRGVIKWFDNRRGFGFIRQGKGLDVFVHYSAIEAKGFRRLEEGEIVYYSKTLGPKGPFADRVVKAGVVSNCALTSEKQLGVLLDSLESVTDGMCEGIGRITA